MRLKKMMIPVGALVFALGAGGRSEAAQRGDQRDRGGRQNQGQAQQSGRERDQGTATRERERRGDYNPLRVEPSQRDSRRDDRNQGGKARLWRGDDRVLRSDGRGGWGYLAPRDVPRPRAFRHDYQSGGYPSVYFGLGSGYGYGSPYDGRVYGYSAPIYGSRLYYGDVRLQVRPRDAAVYVDGYYAGIVDNFDGVFQRLTLPAGPHQIEIEAPGLEPRVFDIYVDPTRTVNLRADLF